MDSNHETHHSGAVQPDVAPPGNANLAEKGPVAASSDHEEYSRDLQKIDTSATGATLGVDMKNRDAVKGDDSDGVIDWNVKTVIAIISLSGLYAGSQIPLYFVGGELSFIAEDVGGASASAWLPVSYALVLGSVCPFCGYLQDLFGRRIITIAGACSLIIGCIVLATSHSLGQAIVGMALCGAGAGIGELTALAGTAELVPVHKRGYYVGLVILFILPFDPYILYCQLLSTYHSWRWGIWICLIWNAVWLVGIVLFYFPHSQTRAHGQTSREILKRIDYFGGFLSIGGLTLFLVALQAGGYSHPWASAYVLCPLLIGVLLIISFVFWEWKGARNPMIPRELFAGQRIVGMAYGIAFVAGMNFYALLNFFPLELTSVFDPNPVTVGLRGFASSMCTTSGAVIINGLLTVFKGHHRELLFVHCVLMTAFGGALAAVTPDTPKMIVGLSTVASWGIGGVIVPAATIALIVTPDASIATCVALAQAVRTIGGSIGYAIYYNVFINKLTPKLPAYVAEYAIKAGLPVADAKLFVGTFLEAPKNITQVPGITPAIIEAATIGTRWAYADSLKYVWLTSIPFGIVATIACIFLGNPKPYMTNRIAGAIRHDKHT